MDMDQALAEVDIFPSAFRVDNQTNHFRLTLTPGARSINILGCRSAPDRRQLQPLGKGSDSSYLHATATQQP